MGRIANDKKNYIKEVIVCKRFVNESYNSLQTNKILITGGRETQKIIEEGIPFF